MLKVLVIAMLYEVSCDDTIVIDTDYVMDEIEDDELAETEHAFRWERDLDQNLDNMDRETIIII